MSAEQGFVKVPWLDGGLDWTEDCANNLLRMNGLCIVYDFMLFLELYEQANLSETSPFLTDKRPMFSIIFRGSMEIFQVFFP